MHIKHMHEIVECLAEYGKDMVKAGTGDGNANLEEAEKIIEMISEISKAEYYARISKAMEEAEKEDEEEAKRMLKEMKEQYGDDEGERRFYDNYRYKRTGRYAPKGRGSYVGRRGYEEPMYYMPLEMYHNYTPEELRDFDREQGRMYYSGGMGNGNSGNMSGGGSSSNGRSGGMSGSNGGNSSSRGYSDGYDDGNRRGYEEGYRDGESRGRNSQNRDSREGRSGRSRRTYMETKEMNRDNSAEGKQKKMKELETYMGELSGDITEMINDASPEEKALLKQKLQVLTQKIS